MKFEANNRQQYILL